MGWRSTLNWCNTSSISSFFIFTTSPFCLFEKQTLLSTTSEATYFFFFSHGTLSSNCSTNLHHLESLASKHWDPFAYLTTFHTEHLYFPWWWLWEATKNNGTNGFTPSGLVVNGALVRRIKNDQNKFHIFTFTSKGEKGGGGLNEILWKFCPNYGIFTYNGWYIYLQWMNACILLG